MFRIPLTKGEFAIVDEDDFERLSQHKWCVRFQGSRKVAVRGGGKIYMHREVMGNPDSMIDHINLNPLDNRKSNLRLANHSTNGANQATRTSSKSGYKGVVWEKDRSKFRAQIKVNGVTKNLGRFTSAYDAAKAYNEAAIESFGEFARLNLIGVTTV